MNKKAQLEFSWYIGIGFCIGYKNHKPKSQNFISSDESLTIIIPFLSVMILWSKEYKK